MQTTVDLTFTRAVPFLGCELKSVKSNSCDIFLRNKAFFNLHSNLVHLILCRESIHIAIQFFSICSNLKVNMIEAIKGAF